ncbi:MAG: thioesterase II family protein [Ferrovibrionaceae bacterium]
MTDQVTLFCLPHAGACAAAYRGWTGQLPGWLMPVPLHLPGRGLRRAEAVVHDWPTLIDRLVRDALPHLARPYAIFGHSMGALVGLELAHALRGSGAGEPLWFGASGCTAPTRREPEPDWLDCPDATVVDELRRLDGTPPELIEDPEMLALLLPSLRADFHLCGTHAPPSRAPLSCPLLVLGGRSDEIAADPANLLDWARETAGPFNIAMFDGGHFFVETARGQDIATVVDAAARATFAPGRRHG